MNDASYGGLTGAMQGAGAGAALGPWGAAAGAVVGGLSGIFGQKSQEKARKKQLKQLMQMHDQLEVQRRFNARLAIGELTGARRELRRGFDRSRQALSGAFRGAQIDTLDQGKQVMAQIERDLISSGRWSTDALQWARIGVGNSTSRVMSDIAGRSAAEVAALEQRRGGALAAARGALAQQHNLNYSNLRDITNSRMEVMGADVPGSRDYSDAIGGLFGALGALWPSGGDPEMSALGTPQSLNARGQADAAAQMWQSPFGGGGFTGGEVGFQNPVGQMAAAVHTNPYQQAPNTTRQSPRANPYQNPFGVR